jgi:predicted ABC-type ATPase
MVAIILNLDIISRNVTNMENLLFHLSLIDHLVINNNSKTDGEIILEADKYGIKNYVNELPDWSHIIEQQLNRKG